MSVNQSGTEFWTPTDIRESFLLGSVWAGASKGQGFRLTGVGLALGNPNKKEADGTNALVELRISGLSALQLEDHQLVAKDQELDLNVHLFVGTASYNRTTWRSNR